MEFITDEEFWRLHNANRKTGRYRSMRTEMILSDPRCWECGLSYQRRHSKWRLHMDHKRYRDDQGNLIFGKEQKRDFRLVCPDHHRRGTRTDEMVSIHRSSYLITSCVVWLIKLPWVLCKAIIRTRKRAPR